MTARSLGNLRHPGSPHKVLALLLLLAAALVFVSDARGLALI
jgi:hypothetical protein